MILLDGAMGTELERRVTLPSPAWSAHAVDHHPSLVQAVHRAYAAAGATVHTAATFRTSGTSTTRAVELCRSSIQDHHRVAGSMAPVADCYRPDLAPRDALPHHRRSAMQLAEAGVDLLLVETFANPGEALAATQAAVATGLPTWSSLTPGFDGSLQSPDAVARAAAILYDAGATVVLVNCLPAPTAIRWLREVAALGGPWGVYANGRTSTDLTPSTYADLAVTWADAGASIIGGCCYTRPSHIRAVRYRLNGPWEK